MRWLQAAQPMILGTVAELTLEQLLAGPHSHTQHCHFYICVVKPFVKGLQKIKQH